MKINERPALLAGLRRLLFRAPIRLFRLRLGWLFGGRLLLLNHVGRVSGRPRQAVVEVVEHDRGDGSYVLCSGFGRVGFEVDGSADDYRAAGRELPFVRLVPGPA